MTAFRKILVPVDFSPHSDHALEVAVDLCRQFGATLGIVHVYEPTMYAGAGGFMMPPSTTEQAAPGLLASRRSNLEKTGAAARAAGVREVQTELLEGVTFHEIVRCATNGGYDLIVIGTHGRTGFGRVLIGSVAERVVRKAPCAVLAVRLGEQGVKEVGAARKEEVRP